MGIVFFNVYWCSDGEYLIGVNQDMVFGCLCEVMGCFEFVVDLCYVDYMVCGCNQVELDELIIEWMLKYIVEDVEVVMIVYSILAGKIYKLVDMLIDFYFVVCYVIVDVVYFKWDSFKM